AVVGTYTVTYNVKDSSNNNADQKTRMVNVVDTKKPVISVLGSNPVTVEAGSSYTDAGATASDDVDGNITSSMITANPVNTAVVGTYTVTYNVKDSSNNNADPKTRTVNVVDTLTIIHFEPSTSPTTQIGTGVWFRISLNKIANVTWYIDDSIVNTTSNVKESGYYSKTIGVGTHTVKANASDGYVSVSKTWGWAVDGGTGRIHNQNTGINYNTIQAAIDDRLTLDGHTILVDPITYYENVIVGKRLTIRSDPAGAVITSNKTDTIFKVTVPYVNISGFSISGAKDTGSKIAGIYLTSTAHHSIISNNEVTTNNYGIYLDASSNNMLSDNNISNNQGKPNEFCFLNICIPLPGPSSGHGIYLTDSSNNMLIRNNANSNKINGIYMSNSHNNTLTDNNANSNIENGIYLSNSNKNNLSNNIMNGNIYNFRLDASSDSDLDNQIKTSNKVDGKSIYYINGAINTIYDSSENIGTFYCVNCVNITVKDQDLKNNGVGILLWNSINAKIYNNNLTGNQRQAIVNGGSGNVFNLTSEIGGNYWSDYTGTDANGDGIGDTPYVISAGVQDVYPYIKANGWKLPRELSLKINGGERLTFVRDVTLDLSAKNAKQMRFKNEDGNWTDWESFSSTKPWTLSSGSGLKTVYFDASNDAGIAAEPAKNEIVLDAPSVIINHNTIYTNKNNGIKYTNSQDVTLTLSSLTAKSMKFRNDLSIWTSWENFKFTKSWRLSNGDGPKTVSFKISPDLNPTIDPTQSETDEITLDMTPVVVKNLSASLSLPEINQQVTIKANVSDNNINSSSIFVSIEYPKGSNINPDIIPMNGNGELYSTITKNTSIYGRYNVAISASDFAGNINNTVKTWFVTTMPPYNDAIQTFANKSLIINATEQANTTLELVTKIDTSGSIKITMYGDIQPEFNQIPGLTPLGKYISVDATNTNTNLNWVILKIYYTKAELQSSGLGESSLKILWYNESANPNRWETLNSGINSTAGYVWANISHLSTFALAGNIASNNGGNNPSSSGSGGGGGGGGGGGSGENYSNIEVIEKYDMAIYKDKLTSYKFTDKRNPIRFVNITGDVNSGEITAMIEVLKGTSSLLKISAPGLVYKNQNIWVGTT
ncbi:MAG: NosD domain-containing protein, partial [Candidatus Methanoperedens sp.]